MRGRAVAWLLAAAAALPEAAGAKALGPIAAPALPEPAGPPPAPASHVRLEVVFRLEPVFRALDAVVPRDLRDPRRVDTTSVEELDRKPDKRGGPGLGPDDVTPADPKDAPYEGPVPWRGLLRRGPWSVSGAGDSLTLEAPLQHSVEVLLPGRLAARCGSPAEPWLAHAGCESRLAWGDGWALETRARMLPTSFEKRCKPNPPGLNFTRRLNDQVNERLVAMLPAALDSAVRRSTRVGEAVSAALDMLAEPLALEDTVAWLRWNPGRVSVDPPRVAGDSITAEVSFEARPEIVPAAGARATVALGEPNVRLSGDALRIPYHCWVDYSEVERAILAARETAGSAEGPGLLVTAARVRGARDRVVVALDLAGPLEGTVYLAGTLAVTSPGYVLHAPDLDWSPETRRRLRSSLPGRDRRVLESVLEEVRREVRQSLTRPLEDCLRGWERAIVDPLRGDRGRPASVVANFNRREVAQVFCTERAIGVQVVTSGRARIALGDGR
jgi:hypothetical protein